MEFLVYLSQPLVSYVRVDLRRTYVAMSQHHLHRSKVSPVFEQVSSKAVAKCMAGTVLVNTRLSDCSLDRAMHTVL